MEPKKPLRPITQLIISIAIIVLVVAATIFLFKYPQKLGPIFITALVITLASFLLLLVLRHFILTWFSYLHQRELAYEPAQDNYPFVSIIVPAFNEGEVIQASLSSLLELRYPYYEIIAVDDGSTDNTYEKMREFEGNHYGVRVSVFRKENSGKADTLNYGIRRSKAPIVVCMDSDSRLTSYALRYAVRHFNDPHVGACERKAIAYTEPPEELLDIIKQRYRWSRGILQALRKQKHLLARTNVHITTPLSLWYMIFEGLVWPAMNIFANLFFVWIALIYGMTKLLVMW